MASEFSDSTLALARLLLAQPGTRLIELLPDAELVVLDDLTEAASARDSLAGFLARGS